MFRSEDGGATWKLGENLLTGQRPTHLLIAPRSPRTLYAALLDAYPGTLLGLFKSTDAATTWSATSKFFVPGDTACAAGPVGLGSARVLAIDPGNSATLYTAPVPGAMYLSEALQAYNSGDRLRNLGILRRREAKSSSEVT